MAIALSDTVFPGNLSDYDTDASSFSPSINIALAPSPASLGDGSTGGSELTNLSLRDHYTYKAYVAMNGPSHASVD